MRLLLSGILCLGYGLGQGQLLHAPVQLPYTTSVSFSRFQHDAFSFHTNPAAMHLLQGLHFGLSGVQPFRLPGVRSGTVSVAIPAGTTRFGGYVQQYGNSSFGQTTIQFSAAQSIGKRGSLGAGFQYRSVAASGYGATGMWGAGLGGLLLLSDEWQAGSYLFFPAAFKASKSEERLAGYFNATIAGDLSPQVYVAATIAKTEGHPPEVHAAVSYRIVPQMSARMGIQSGTKELFIGSGFLYKKMQLHFFTGLHPRLGFSPGLQLLLGQNKGE